MTMRFRVYALSSNADLIDGEIAPKKGIDGFVDEPVGTVVAISDVPTAQLRQVVGEQLRLRIEDAKRVGTDRIFMTLGHRASWTNLDLDAVDNGIIDGAAALVPHAIDWAYPPFIEPAQ